MPGTYDRRQTFEQEVALGQINGKTVYYRAWGEMQLYYRSGKLASYLKASSTLNNQNRRVELTYNFNKGYTTRKDRAISTLGTTYEQMSDTMTYSALPLNSAETALLTPTVRVRIYTTIMGITTNELDVTVNLTCVSDLDYSKPTASIGNVEMTTSRSFIVLSNIAASHSTYALLNAYVEVERNGSTETTPINFSGDSVSVSEIVISEIGNDIPVGQQIVVRIKATAENGQIGYSSTVTFNAPAAVTAVIITDPGALRVGTDKQLYYTLQGEDGYTPAIQTVTFTSSDTSIATVNSSGVIHPVAAGACVITVTSGDDWAGNPHSSVSIAVASGTFPAFADNYDVLSAETMDDIEDACTQLAVLSGISITALDKYDGVSTWLKDVWPTLNTTNENIKALCAVSSSIHHTLPATFPLTNDNAKWHSIINEWVDLIQEIYEVVS